MNKVKRLKARILEIERVKAKNEIDLTPRNWVKHDPAMNRLELLRGNGWESVPCTSWPFGSKDGLAWPKEWEGLTKPLI